jgi:hypothetical protein
LERREVDFGARCIEIKKREREFGSYFREKRKRKRRFIEKGLRKRILDRKRERCLIPFRKYREIRVRIGERKRDL